MLRMTYNNFVNIFQAIILGIVQGLTEFLPVSSTAHLRIVPSLLSWQDPGTAFSAVIQLGTVLAVIFYFYSDLKKIYGSLISDLKDILKSGLDKRPLKSFDSKLGFWILFGTIPICFFGLLFKNALESGLIRDLKVIAFSLIIVGILLLIVEKISKQNKSLKDLNFFDVLWIGFAQSLALIPGVSRSGITILSALLIGLKRDDSARFSFLLSVPAVVLSGLLELKTMLETIKAGEEQVIWINVILGTISAFISGYFSIDFLIKYLKDHKTYLFVGYRVILGLIIIYLSYKGLIV